MMERGVKIAEKMLEGHLSAYRVKDGTCRDYLPLTRITFTLDELLELHDWLCFTLGSEGPDETDIIWDIFDMINNKVMIRAKECSKYIERR